MNNIIANTADVADSAIILNSTIGEHCMIGANTRFCYSNIGDYSYVSVNSNVFSTLIGKYSSISWNVSLGPANHDYNRISSHAMLFATRFGMIDKGNEMYNQYAGDVIVGNDVWIGCNALIMRKVGGVKIGDGAIVGANAIVTKDVPPYAIVVGRNKILKYRFEADIIAALIDLAWWNFPANFVKTIIPLLAKNPTLEIIKRIQELYIQFKITNIR